MRRTLQEAPRRMPSPDIVLRRAVAADLPAIVALLADDPLGRMREDPLMPLRDAYRDAFAVIDRDPHQLLMVADEGQAAVGTLQLTFIPGLTRLGAWRGQMEGVRIHRDHRGGGLGQRMMEWAIARCRERGCRLVQLTTDRTRPDAHRFYERLGFVATHLGYKLDL
jgi:GNAT superfamily N-acetyltransferase